MRFARNVAEVELVTVTLQVLGAPDNVLVTPTCPKLACRQTSLPISADIGSIGLRLAARGVSKQMQAESRTQAAEFPLGWRGARSSISIVIAIAALGAVLVFIAYWPGIMIDDARWQYQQVVDNAYEDWHPPLMAWIWRHLTVLMKGPAPMLALQVLLYWAGFALIATSAAKRGHKLLGLVLAVWGFLPATFALSGTVTKDALMDGVLLAASGMILWRPLVQIPAARMGLSLGAIALLFVAAALRFNAFFACVPLALAALPRRF